MNHVARRLFGMALWAVAVLWVASAPRAQTPAPDIKTIIDRGTLVVAMYNHDTPPFYYTDETGTLTGFDVRLITGFAQRLGVKVEFNRQSKSFDEVVDTVARGEADVAISKLSRTFARATRVSFTRPYLVLRQGLLVNRLELARQAGGQPIEKAMRALKGRIGVIAGSSYEEFARRRFPEAEVAGFPTWDAALDAAAAGKVTAAYRDELEVKKIIRSQPDRLINFQTVVLSDTRDPIAIAVNWRSPNLLALLETYLDDLDLHLTADSILDEYMPLPARAGRGGPKR